MHASSHFCLISCLLRRIFLELGESDPWIATDVLDLLSPEVYPMGIFQAGPWTGQSLLSWSPVILPFVLFPPLGILNSTIVESPQQRLPPNLHILDHFFHVCKYDVQQITSSCKLLYSFYARNYHQRTPGTFWIACVHLCYPSTGIRWLRSLMRTNICKCELWRRLYLLTDQTVSRRHPPQCCTF